MRESPKSCSPATNLADVVKMFCSSGCGALPVIDANEKIVGMITDRDICVATGMRDVRPSQLLAEQVMSRQVATCHTQDDVHAALGIMRKKKVQRLPVTNESGELEGVICVSDLVVSALHNDGKKPELSYEDIIGTLKSIYWRERGEHCPEVGIQ
jgi:CBS-domain-containing membrane protein